MLNFVKPRSMSAMAKRKAVPVFAGADLRQPPRLVGASGVAAPLSKGLIASAALLALGACDAAMTQTSNQPTGFIEVLPEQVVALAAPNQNLQAVQLRPEDGCYWYRYSGPVETTMLPLRTVDGRPICTRPRAEG